MRCEKVQHWAVSTVSSKRLVFTLSCVSKSEANEQRKQIGGANNSKNIKVAKNLNSALWWSCRRYFCSVSKLQSELGCWVIRMGSLSNSPTNSCILFKLIRCTTYNPKRPNRTKLFFVKNMMFTLQHNSLLFAISWSNTTPATLAGWVELWNSFSVVASCISLCHKASV